MEDQKIESGKILENTEKLNDQVKEIQKILGTENFMVFMKKEGLKCQRENCQKDHMMVLVSKMEEEDIYESVHVFEHLIEALIDKKGGGIPSPF